MQGISLADFKKLLASLNNLSQIEMMDFTEDHFKKVIEKEKRLKEIYANYQLSLQLVSENIRQFEDHKLAIRKLMKESRLYLKNKKKAKALSAAIPGQFEHVN